MICTNKSKLLCQRLCRINCDGRKHSVVGRHNPKRRGIGRINFVLLLSDIQRKSMKNNNTHIIKRTIQKIIDQYLANKENTVYILEAGCGSSSKFHFNEKTKIHGIDISKEQLKKNKILDKKIFGDIQTYQLEKQYDIVICWDVLEHLPNPVKAMHNILSWTKENGLLIISVPNVMSIKGIITKFTPYWFHILAYKRIFKYKSRPFPTYLKFSMAPQKLLQYSFKHKIVYKDFAKYSFSNVGENLYKIIAKISDLVTFKNFYPDKPQFYVVIKKENYLRTTNRPESSLSIGHVL